MLLDSQRVMEYPESELMNYVFHGCPKLNEKRRKMFKH
jgi:hypothetical protein